MDKEQQSQASRKRPRIESVFAEGLILASSSPRRSEILQTAGWPFSVFPVDVDETRHDGEEAEAYVQRLAETKAMAAVRCSEAGLFVGADTIVLLNGEIMGKPIDDEDARRMIGALQGQWHQVLTGVALVRKGGRSDLRVAYESTKVRFSEMTEEEIEWLVNNGSPLDKAGAYAVQGHAALFIEEIAGDYWNVVGLPLQLLYRLAISMSEHDPGA